MKKTLSLILTITLVTCIFSSTSLYSASAYEEVAYEDEYENDKDLHGSIFKADTRHLDHLQLTDSQLQSDTATLLDLVLKSGLINPLYAEDPGFTVYRALVNSYNGLQELEKRKDAGTVMLQRYMKKSLVKLDEMYNNAFEICQLSELLCQDVYRSKLSSKEINSIRVADECYNNQMLWPTVTVLCNVE